MAVDQKAPAEVVFSEAIERAEERRNQIDEQLVRELDRMSAEIEDAKRRIEDGFGLCENLFGRDQVKIERLAAERHAAAQEVTRLVRLSEAVV